MLWGNLIQAVPWTNFCSGQKIFCPGRWTGHYLLQNRSHTWGCGRWRKDALASQCSTLFIPFCEKCISPLHFQLNDILVHSASILPWYVLLELWYIFVGHLSKSYSISKWHMQKWFNVFWNLMAKKDFTFLYGKILPYQMEKSHFKG